LYDAKTKQRRKEGENPRSPLRIRGVCPFFIQPGKMHRLFVPENGAKGDENRLKGKIGN
jgi:hypothetical protein